MRYNLFLKDKDDNEYSLLFEVYSTDIANKWFASLVEQCQKSNEIIEKDRFYNFPDSEWTEEKIVGELNSCIETINQYKHVIDHLAYTGMSQDQLNILHVYFEKLRGGVLAPTSFFVHAPKEIKEAVERYNVLIHRAENFYNGKNKVLPRIVCRFKDRKRFLLADEDYEEFTFQREYGEVYINYCEVGKPIYDVFKDGDDVVGEDNIRPLRYYSPDFTVYFYNRSQESVQKFIDGMDKWWDENNEHLSKLGFQKGDPKNAMGYIPVARLISNETKEEVVSKMCKYNIMDRVEVLQ
jgi:hypothetical protein